MVDFEQAWNEIYDYVNEAAKQWSREYENAHIAPSRYYHLGREDQCTVMLNKMNSIVELLKDEAQEDAPEEPEIKATDSHGEPYFPTYEEYRSSAAPIPGFLETSMPDQFLIHKAMDLPRTRSGYIPAYEIELHKLEQKNPLPHVWKHEKVYPSQESLVSALGDVPMVLIGRYQNGAYYLNLKPAYNEAGYALCAWTSYIMSENVRADYIPIYLIYT